MIGSLAVVPWVLVASWHDCGPVKTSLDAAEDVSHQLVVDNLNRLDGKLVRLAGFFEWEETPDTDGVLHAAPLARYMSEPKDQIHISFSCPTEIRHELQYRWIDVVGVVTNVCREQELGDFAKATLCHGSTATAKLNVVRILEVEERRYFPIVAELNRGRVNIDPTSFIPLKLAAKLRAELELALRAWARDVLDGRHEAEARGSGWNRYLREQLSAKLRRLSKRLPPAASFQFFGHSGIDLSLNNQRVVGCACIEQTCSGTWPLTRMDARFSIDGYVCETLIRRNGRWEWEHGFKRGSL